MSIGRLLFLRAFSNWTLFSTCCKGLRLLISSQLLFVLMASAPYRVSGTGQANPADPPPVPDRRQSALAMVNDAENLVREFIAEVPNEAVQNSVIQGVQKLVEEIKACGNRYNRAYPICDPEINEDLKETVSTLGGIMQVLSATASMLDKCSKFSQAMQVVDAGISTYRLGCGTVQQSCLSSCSEANFKRIANQVIQKCDEYKNEPNPDPNDPNEAEIRAKKISGNACVNFFVRGNGGDRIEVTQEFFAACNQFGNQMGQAAMAIPRLVTGYQAAQECEEATSSSDDPCRANPNSIACKELKMAQFCEDPKNQSTAQCFCQANPGDPTCDANRRLLTQNNNSGGNGTVLGLNDDDMASEFSAKGELGDDIDLTNKENLERVGNPSNGGGGPMGGGGFPMGGAGMMAGGGGGRSGAGLSPEAAGGGGGGRSSVNPDVLGGFTGGGGGGGGRARSAGSYRGLGDDQARRSISSGANNPRLKDLEKLVPKAFQAAKKDVTEADGLTNWQKVSIIYRGETDLDP